MATELFSKEILMYIDQNIETVLLCYFGLLLHDFQKGFVVFPTHRLCPSPTMAQPHNV